LYRDIWRHNVKQLLAENNLSIAEAARLVGTSKQYLSSILAETEPSSMRELVADRLSLLLHATPARLYTPSDRNERANLQLARHYAAACGYRKRTGIRTPSSRGIAPSLAFQRRATM
jgi:AraC-like DNA-binding protein